MPRAPEPVNKRCGMRPKPMAAMVSALFILSWAPSLLAVELKAETVRAWDRYLQWADEKVRRELSNPDIFLRQNTLLPADKAALQKQLDSGHIVARRMVGVVPSGTGFEVPSGEIHHWWGAILLRNVTMAQLMQFLQDYDRHGGKFADVERSRLISRQGNQYKVFYRLRRTKAFVTASFNTEQDCTFTFYDGQRAFSQSVATKLAEVVDAGTPSEHENPPGNDRGFLWRLVSWWRYEQRGNDVIVELESASLSRDIPPLIKIIPGLSSAIHATPRETLESVLAGIRLHFSK